MIESPTKQDVLAHLRAELAASNSQVLEVIDELLREPESQAWRARCFCIGYSWHDEQRDPDDLARLGLALAPLVGHDPAQFVSELLLGYAASREDRRSHEWEQRLLRRVAELDGLHRIISAANSSLDLDTSLQTVAETVASVIGADVCSIYLFDRDMGTLTLRATHGLDRGAVGHVTLRLGEGATGWAAQEGQPLVLEDAWSDVRFKVTPRLDERPYRSMVAVPIILFASSPNDFVGDQLQGVISVQTTRQRSFREEEVHFLEVVAGELAFSIANARRYLETDERLRRKVRELSTLQRVSAAIASTLDLGTVLGLIAEQAVVLSSSDRADIFEYNEDTSAIELIASWGGRWDERLRRMILRSIADGHPIAVVSAYDDMRFPELAAFAYGEGFHSLFCLPLRIGERIIGAIVLYTRQQRFFDYEQVQLLSSFADEAAIAIENARLFREVQRNLRIKSTLLQEMHHRVRNNLQTISALLTMQLRRLDPASPGAHALAQSISRIQAIAAVHNLLCREDIGVTTVQDIARQVVDNALVGLVGETPVQVRVEGEALPITSREATIIALVINELIHNALTHGVETHGGVIVIETRYAGLDAVLEVRDNGPTLPPAPPKPSSGLGLSIIETLVSADLGGAFSFQRDEHWSRAQVRWPYAPPHPDEER
ncbi:GAF domain-containing protein [Kallotenue papyrolyticum]|uniref:GAF domain-containing protein n=1 Tax=Kallotenue papyrolyticum TaxID=1325125 RepID=UPI0004785FFD|nr:GAF domain-containing protein [Kallotenue papyrolyticum]